MDDLRTLALYLLDDPHGISASAYWQLQTMLVKAGHLDIVNRVKGTEGRFYLPEGAFEELSTRPA